MEKTEEKEDEKGRRKNKRTTEGERGFFLMP
jgi:hypothetical protein